MRIFLLFVCFMAVGCFGGMRGKIVERNFIPKHEYNTVLHDVNHGVMMIPVVVPDAYILKIESGIYLHNVTVSKEVFDLVKVGDLYEQVK